ncbi:MAG: PD-(D/E)XK nuclease family protein [Puniceicoccales bacterium]|nr:PD-(D/E)XK nuclease family protein [Puniceicoccales bacterium]
MLGWLELLWEDAPHLIVAGLNEGWVPESDGGDAFLPGSFRVKLGLPSDDVRVAAGVYALQKLLAQRAGGRGRVDVFVLQADGQENPLRPSRLLFTSAGADLPARVRRLFAEPAVASPEPSWVAGWRLAPPVSAVRLNELAERFHVTGFRDYLDCPFRFYLRHVLGMQGRSGEEKFEPDAREFGAMVHAALEAFAREETVRDSVDADEIAGFAQGALEAFLTRNYGRRWPLPVVVAAESARNRLGAFARVQARLRAEGWRVVMGEVAFGDLMGEGRVFRLEETGVAVSGKIDRVDFHEKLGWRILDYKTAASAVLPGNAHMERLRGDPVWPPEFARLGGAERRWVDLQLPLYRHVFGVARAVAFEEVQLAYFNLPQAVSETGVFVWENYSRELETSALACARGVCAGIAARRFWPPNPHVRHDAFETLLSPGAEAVVDAEAFLSALSGDAKG